MPLWGQSRVNVGVRAGCERMLTMSCAGGATERGRHSSPLLGGRVL